MRALLKTLVIGLCGIVGLAQLTDSAQGQSALLPPGRPVLFGKGILPTEIVHVPVDPGNSVVPMPGQQVGFFMPALRKLMFPPKTGGILGTSVVPDARQFPGSPFPILPALPKDKNKK